MTSGAVVVTSHGKSALALPQDKEEKKISFKTLAEETTLHGISKAVNADYTLIRR